MKALTASQGDDLQKLHAELEDLHTQMQNSVEELSASQGGLEGLHQKVEGQLQDAGEILRRAVNAELSHQKSENGAHKQLTEDITILHQGLTMLTQALSSDSWGGRSPDSRSKEDPPASSSATQAC